MATTVRVAAAEVPILNEVWDNRKDMTASLQLFANAHNKTVVTNQALSDGKTVTLVCKSRVVDGKVDGNVICKAQFRGRMNKGGKWSLIAKSTQLEHTACGGQAKITSKGATKLKGITDALSADRAATVHTHARA